MIPTRAPDVSVIICTHDEARRADLADALTSVAAQTAPPLETVVVVDNNPTLLARLCEDLPGVRVVGNDGARGASGARNTGARHASGDWLAFFDDDAVAEPDWLEVLAVHRGDPTVLGVGGGLTPLWERQRPAWFPDEFAWVVGASYRGLPTVTGPVRNVWAGNMLVNRQVFAAVDGFRVGFGKTGGRSAPEDTDFCLRTQRAFPTRQWLYEPAAQVGHKVPRRRARMLFFLQRCYSEGQGKAALVRLLSRSESMSSELRHAGTLPAAMARELLACSRGDRHAPLRMAAMLVGLAAATAGLARGMCKRSPRVAVADAGVPDPAPGAVL
ncbi:MAG: glycosyltransferase family 2 protein [Sciscionella sp.]